MNRKTIGIIIVIILLTPLAAWRYYHYGFYLDVAENYSSPSPKEVSQGKALAKLQSNLPYTTDDFIIERLDYKIAKFIVKTNGTAEAKQKFEEWLIQSNYKDIPLKRFKIE